ncbi:unnamed protein product [Cuscuta epithymum]|uniref:Uncharacterized protein n=1 Tax=Cuscuta epithymum TaxID=186058 RepID=A0AAV0FXA3_9ASTE|nr:unnamed protein product [Cuscuta epithymum]CAH9139948.1 unnamed protein product [Cuscuta epithymum]
MLKMDDIYQMYLAFQELPVVRDRSTQDGFDALKRFMIRQIKFFASHDLQMALETNLPKTDLSRPKMYGPELEDYPTYYIFDSPVTLIYLNHNGEKRMMFIDELNKYCDGTRKTVKQKLQPIRKEFEERQQKYADATDAELTESNRIDKVLKAIEKQLDRRRSLKNYEHALNLRKHYYRAQKQEIPKQDDN